ncbi:MAG: amidase [Acidobacteriota bacterium]|jgi:amidase|nr:amidase [Acidobacteriota bacterium]
MSAVKLATLIRSRVVSTVEVVEAHLRRIENVNARLNAVVTLAPRALEHARELDAAVAGGETQGALHGVPLTVKDTIDVRGLLTTAGSRVRAGVIREERAGYVPEGDATSVARLRAAGAIIIGKTNCAEFALDYTSENPVFGRTNNPHDLARTPGGSSGGCAAAVSACLTAGSLGSDLAGSIRIPAHFCGVAGLKPTARRVPSDGHVPPLSAVYTLAASLGPLARNVGDLHLFFQVLAGVGAAPAFEDGSQFASEVSRATGHKLKDLRVAWYADDGTVPVSEETRAAVREAAHALGGAGLEVAEEIPPGVERATTLWLSLFEWATQRFVGASYAGREEEAGRAARVILERAAKCSTPTLESFLKAWEERDRVRALLLRWMEQTPLFVAPVGAVPAFRHHEFGRIESEGRTLSTFRAFGYTHAANVFDLPAVCVPAGRTREGLPIGVQIVGRPFEEERVLAAARVVEEALGGWQPPPEPLSTEPLSTEPLPNASRNPL